jgi:hypothetical protein
MPVCVRATESLALHTVKEMCSLFILISNSCLPFLSGSGQLRSSSLVISLSLMILLISPITMGLNLTKEHYMNWSVSGKLLNASAMRFYGLPLTFLSDHSVVLIVGVVCISQPPVRRDFKFHILVTETTLMPHVIPTVEVVGHFQNGASISLESMHARVVSSRDIGNALMRPQQCS